MRRQQAQLLARLCTAAAPPAPLLRLRNVPRLALKEDVTELLAAAGVSVPLSALHVGYDERLRSVGWFVTTPDANAALATLSQRRLVLSSRTISVDTSSPPPVHPQLAGFQGRTVAVSGLQMDVSAPPVTLSRREASVRDVLRLFERSGLATDAPPVVPLSSLPGTPKGGPQQTVLVRFASEFEARCAAQQKHRTYCGSSIVEVRLLV